MMHPCFRCGGDCEGGAECPGGAAPVHGRCAAGFHEYEPRYDESPCFVGPAGYNRSMYIACKLWIGDACKKCHEWKPRPRGT